MTNHKLCLSDVRGHLPVKRALEIAAAGGHSIALVGPPGASKTMLARRLSTILPTLTEAEAAETTKIYEDAGLLPHTGPITERPFRAPHHTISVAALCGGRMIPRPGEASLAHNGILFLDEYPEFQRRALEALKLVIEDREAVITGRPDTVRFPAAALIVTGSNDCPCGYRWSVRQKCRCEPSTVRRYHARTSSHLTQMSVKTIDVRCDQLPLKPGGDSSETIRERVVQARLVQKLRLGEGRTNASMSPNEVTTYTELDEETRPILEYCVKHFAMSARKTDNTLRVARTIADLDGTETLNLGQVVEAVCYCAR